jgi:diguanylate cyclase (GGDEF)-like protein
MKDSKLMMFPARNITMDDLTFQIPHIVARVLLNSATMVTGRIKTTRKNAMENMSWVQKLYRKAYEDPGTGLWKQTFLADELERHLEDPMALIMLKPDRFKILVDALGHGAGDEAMVKIAKILKLASRKLGRGWPLRFKSNETGILINKCDEALAQEVALSLYDAIAALPPVSLSDERRQEYDEGDFNFSTSIVWGIWPADNINWQLFFEETYSLLLDTWRDGGNKIVRYKRRQPT